VVGWLVAWLGSGSRAASARERSGNGSREEEKGGGAHREERGEGERLRISP